MISIVTAKALTLTTSVTNFSGGWIFVGLIIAVLLASCLSCVDPRGFQATPEKGGSSSFNSCASAVNVKLGESVDVLIDPDNPERYTITSIESISMKKR